MTEESCLTTVSDPGPLPSSGFCGFSLFSVLARCLVLLFLPYFRLFLCVSLSSGRVPLLVSLFLGLIFVFCFLCRYFKVRSFVFTVFAVSRCLVLLTVGFLFVFYMERFRC